ncbi:hypothetical protein GF420_08510 [candidate division GN15 bacterium]|nr:hypothetical protein [candidate division GN15 bacterium]
MPPKRAKFLTYGSDAMCAETRQFIEDAGVLLEVRDIEEKPLSEEEIDRLIRHIDPRHFLNVVSPTYEKHGFDKQLPDRPEMIKLIAEDHTLLRRPIIETARLVTVGCDKKSISQMLQISMNGNKESDQGDNNDRHNRRSQRHNNRQATAAR